jgi:hypothetical protein
MMGRAAPSYAAVGGGLDQAVFRSNSEAAMALVPSMTFLVHEAHRAGLDEISDMLTQTLADMTRWIEEQDHGQSVG